ncbi:hypothetical protein Anapl_11683 [Anas platyrhynchos]|uniref:Uncharacterized protein n=1 Tax=Anas platyrhynchos TaxID=8839 RepID=R0JKS9_ANAPL|nr:hypothetical protein Anapl_11683 [Anas platyrhynchos]
MCRCLRFAEAGHRAQISPHVEEPGVHFLSCHGWLTLNSSHDDTASPTAAEGSISQQQQQAARAHERPPSFLNFITLCASTPAFIWQVEKVLMSISHGFQSAEDAEPCWNWERMQPPVITLPQRFLDNILHKAASAEGRASSDLKEIGSGTRRLSRSNLKKHTGDSTPLRGLQKEIPEKSSDNKRKKSTEMQIARDYCHDPMKKTGKHLHVQKITGKQPSAAATCELTQHGRYQNPYSNDPSSKLHIAVEAGITPFRSLPDRWIFRGVSYAAEISGGDVKQEQLCWGHARCRADLQPWYLFAGNYPAIAVDRTEMHRYLIKPSPVLQINPNHQFSELSAPVTGPGFTTQKAHPALPISQDIQTACLFCGGNHKDPSLHTLGFDLFPKPSPWSGRCRQWEEEKLLPGSPSTGSQIKRIQSNLGDKVLQGNAIREVGAINPKREIQATLCLQASCIIFDPHHRKVFDTQPELTPVIICITFQPAALCVCYLSYCHYLPERHRDVYGRIYCMTELRSFILKGTHRQLLCPQQGEDLCTRKGGTAGGAGNPTMNRRAGQRARFVKGMVAAPLEKSWAKTQKVVGGESLQLPCTRTIPLGHAAQGCGYTLQGSSLPVLNFNLRVYSALLHQRMKGREHLRVLQAQREEQGHARGSACRFAVGVACTLPPEGSRRD